MTTTTAPCKDNMDRLRPQPIHQNRYLARIEIFCPKCERDFCILSSKPPAMHIAYMKGGREAWEDRDRTTRTSYNRDLRRNQRQVLDTLAQLSNGGDWVTVAAIRETLGVSDANPTQQRVISTYLWSWHKKGRALQNGEKGMKSRWRIAASTLWDK